MSEVRGNENVEVELAKEEQVTDTTATTPMESQTWIRRLWSWVFRKIRPSPSHLEPTDRDRDGGKKITPLELRKVVEERKFEVKCKAEEERLDGLRRIAALKSGNGVSPFDLFPEEIWVKVLEKWRPEDRANMLLVDIVFRDLLQTTLIQDTFLPLVLKDYQIPLVRKYLLLPIESSRALYFDRPGMERVKLLINLRLVSKGLRDGIDTWFENRLQHIMHTFDMEKGDERRLLNTVDFYLGQDNMQFLNEIVESRPKRFFLKSLSVDFSTCVGPFPNLHDNPYDFFGMIYGGIDIQKRDEFYRTLGERFFILKNNITELLEKCGDQIWHFHFMFHAEHLKCLCVSSEQVYNILREWLILLPNLKWLVLNTPGLVMGNDDTISLEPMPGLCHLERFDLSGDNAIPIGNAIIASNTHIKIHQRSSSRDTSKYSAPSVLTLALESMKFGRNDIGQSLDVRMLQEIPDNNWKLKRMSLWMGSSFGTTTTETHNSNALDEVFRFIQRFPTLEDVSIQVDRVVIGKEINFLQLPNLKDFWIEFGPIVETREESAFFFSLQFLYHCKKLRSVVWRNLMGDLKPIRRMMNKRAAGPKRGIVIDFKGGNVDLSKSNVWDVFPQLRSIKVNLKEGDELSWNCKYISRRYGRRELVAESDMIWFPSCFLP